MSQIWHFLCGDVPGGFALLIVLFIAFFLILEFVYRAGETMHRRTYRRWKRLGPIIIIAGYALVWIQAQPKLEPLRIAVVVDRSSGRTSWQAEAVADLAARRLARTLKKAIINPWGGAAGEYPLPSVEILERSKYRVYQLQWLAQEDDKPAVVRIEKRGVGGYEVEIGRNDIAFISEEIGGWVLSDLGRRTDLKKLYSRDHDPAVLESYYRGRYLAHSEPDSARRYFLRSLDVDSTFTPAKIELACSFEIAGDRPRAEAALLNAVKADTGSLEALLSLGEFYLRGRQWDRAEPPLKIVLTRDPGQVRAHLGLATIHPARLKDLKLNNPAELLEEAVRLDPAFERARVSLAGQLINAGLSGEARKVLREGLRINPGSEAMLLKLGAAELYSGDPEGARRAYEDILAQDPRNAAAAFNLGVVDYRTKQYDSAIRNLHRSLDWDGPVDCYYYLGIIHREKGDDEQAKLFFLKRWELRKSDDDVYAVKAKEFASALEYTADGLK